MQLFRFGGALQTGAQNMDMMLAGRFFAGIGVGFMTDLAPVYQVRRALPIEHDSHSNKT